MITKLRLSHFLHEVYHMGGTIHEYFEFIIFLAILHSLNEFSSVYQNYFKFELQVYVKQFIKKII